MPLTLKLRDCTAPVDLFDLDLDALGGRPLKSIAAAPVLIGRRREALGEVFAASGKADGRWRFEGDLRRVDGMATGLRGATVTADGPVGHRAGAQMRGGRLTLEADAGPWCGAAMRGGAIEVRGDAGDGLGAAYLGDTRGMRGGTIVVRGDAGSETGSLMRRGWIVVAGDCGPLAGYRMLAGTLMVLGRCGPHAGAEMRRGTLALLGGAAPLLPSFRHACRAEPTILRLMRHDLATLGVNAPAGQVDLWSGDLLKGGRGEVWLPA
ncbi:Formyltransferase/hydrolase complex Fhc subunit C [Pirellulimonas nuda]|uniref:Formyltransferase/hydrolase complex Fhc subunit C n=1 Tax=Pirellulimonas nuda TaxID=2528009 RepID=A0A518D610_9BACT|nr:formylmethanofuran dehydrogenase subunit C [Pirellulimonas nuda]QDU86900.1 Formyltransferase/hydrolase complex Fhc subunit C [Pirellulimonas nuda]